PDTAGINPAVRRRWTPCTDKPALILQAVRPAAILKDTAIPPPRSRLRAVHVATAVLARPVGCAAPIAGRRGCPRAGDVRSPCAADPEGPLLAVPWRRRRVEG